MRKPIVILLCFIICLTSQGQQKLLAKSDYEKKAKTHSTLGFVCAGAGILMMGIGTRVFFDWDDNWERNLNTGAGLATAGALLTVGSIPLFIIAGKNKRRAKSAAALHFNISQLPILQNAGLRNNRNPGLR